MTETPDPAKARQAALNVIAAVRSGQCDPRHAAEQVCLSYDQDMIMAVLERAAVDVEALRRDARRWRFTRLDDDYTDDHWQRRCAAFDAEIAALSPEAQAELDKP